MAGDLKSYIAELKRTTAEKERIAQELEIAKDIQQSFLPETVPEIEGIELAAFSLPALEVGGDFYDFIPLAGNRWGLVIADVSGKGCTRCVIYGTFPDTGAGKYIKEPFTFRCNNRSEPSDRSGYPDNKYVCHPLLRNP